MIQETTHGYFSFNDVIEDGERALDAGLYRIALMLALIIPSVCSRIEFKNNPKYRDENGYWKDRLCYVDWCLQQNIKFIDAENQHSEHCFTSTEEYYDHIYDIRCSSVHESAIKCNDIVCNLCINQHGLVCQAVDCNRVNQYDICVIPFCRQMFAIGKQYYNNHKNEFDLSRIPMKMYNLD